ncbi:MAG: MFS transporter [Campylobacterales bacterium]|nr:MFS transporter [Campylobacterales bacterium]
MHKLQVLLKYFYYANPAIALALLGLPLYIYLPTFYAQELKFGVFEVGIVLFIARAFDVFFDLFIGFIADRYAFKKMLIAFGALILVASFYFLSHPSENAGITWLFGFSVLVYVGWSMMSVPYYAIGAQIGATYHQNTLYASAREMFNILGVVTALVLPYIFNVADESSEALHLMFEVIVVSLAVTLSIFLSTVKLPKLQQHFKSFQEAFKSLYEALVHSRALFLSFFLNSFANAIPATLFLLYVELVLEAKQYTGILLIIYFLSGVIALPFWVHLSKKYGKKKVWTASMVSASFFFSCVVFLQSGDIIPFMIITVLSGLSLGADMALPASMQSDIVQNRLEESSGALFGFFAMLTKLSLAAGVGLAFSILGLVSFEPAAPTKNSLLTLSLLYGLAPVALKIAAIYFLRNYREIQNHNKVT